MSTTTAAPRLHGLLPRPDWQQRAAEHEARADALTAGRRERRSAGRGAPRSHPVDDFLYDYHALRPAQLRRWHPGVGTRLADAADAPHAMRRWYSVVGTVVGPEVGAGPGAEVGLDVERFVQDRGRALRATRRLLAAVGRRAPHLGCFGMHEWAMVYRTGHGDGGGEDTGARRHSLPLRLGAAGTDAVVEAHPLRCTHIDAYRFFTPEALPRNAVVPTRETQAALDQPGCVHVSMDVLRHAVALGPACPGELLLDCFAAARTAREVDMRASPYDVSGLTGADGGELPAIAVETREGKAEYVRAQRDLADLTAPLRARLLAVAEAVLADDDQDDDERASPTTPITGRSTP